MRHLQQTIAPRPRQANPICCTNALRRIWRESFSQTDIRLTIVNTARLITSLNVRLSVTDECKLRYALKHPYSKGTTHFLFEPLDLRAKLAALVPRPGVNLTRYHGAFAPNSTLRAQIVPGKPRKKHTTQTATSNLQNRTSEPETAEPTQLTWAQRLKRAFEFDVTVCPLCGGTLRVISDITDPAIIDNILTHIRQSRAPPVHAQKHLSSTNSDQQNQGSA